MDSVKQSDVGFAGRLAYVRWLRNRGRVKPETDAELAEATGVGLPWLTKWKNRDDAPNDRAITNRFATGLGVDTDWLLDNEGDAPEPALWAAWASGPILPGGAKLEKAIPATRAAAAKKKRLGGF